MAASSGARKGKRRTPKRGKAIRPKFVMHSGEVVWEKIRAVQDRERGTVTTDIAVYSAVAFHAGPDGHTWVGTSTIAQHIGADRTTVNRALGRLRKAGVLSWKHGHSYTDAQGKVVKVRSNYYDLPDKRRLHEQLQKENAGRQAKAAGGAKLAESVKRARSRDRVSDA